MHRSREADRAVRTVPAVPLLASRRIQILLTCAAGVLVAACAVPAGTAPGAPGAGSGAAGTGHRLDLAGSSALEWGEGSYGVVLAHGAAFDAASWEDQAVLIAERDATVVAVEDISPAGIAAAVDHLRDRGVRDVALVGGSAGADAILQLASEQPDLPDQLVLLSPNGLRTGLGNEPKLFIASEGEPLVDIARELAETSVGSDNIVLIVPGSAHAQNIFATDQATPVTQAILDRLSRFADA